MPIDPEFLEILRSPDTKKRLLPVDSVQLERINEQIRAGTARTRAGEAVAEPLDGGLMPEGEAVVYPVRGDIPILLVDEAIPLDQAPAANGEA